MSKPRARRVSKKEALECVIATLEQNATLPADVAYALAVSRDALGLKPRQVETTSPASVMLAPLPPGFREGHGGDLACPHRDCSVCAACAAAHVEIVEVYSQHFWIPDPRERAEHERVKADLAAQKAGQS